VSETITTRAALPLSTTKRIPDRDELRRAVDAMDEHAVLLIAPRDGSGSNTPGTCTSLLKSATPT